MREFIFIMLFINLSTIAQILTPLEKNNYEKLTSYNDLIDFIDQIDASLENISKDYFAKTVQGRNIPLIKISKNNFDDDKIKVMIFAQQHGNEQSGKEGALLLLKEIAEEKLDHIFDRINLILIPQLNPDGSEADKRRNGNGEDLNRNHLILTEPETIGLHNIFWKYLPEVTLDVHEYSPYSESWMKFGYRKNFDEQFGTVTNPNVSNEIKKYQKEKFLPFAKKYLNENGFTFQEYILGGPPSVERMRHSTFDINDGRQSFGIMNSFSLILEGKNGKDSIDNIEHRAKGQLAAMKSFLNFVYENSDEIKDLVNAEREKLINGKEKVSIRMEHVKGNENLDLNLRSVSTGNDTTIIVEEYHIEIKKILEVEKPLGYLINKGDSLLISFLKNHNVKFSDEIPIEAKILEYQILQMDTVISEEIESLYPKVEVKETSINKDDYYFVPLNQLQSNLLVLALEPQSMLGLIQYEEFKFLRNTGKYPILRVEK